MSKIPSNANQRTEVFHLNDAEGWELKRIWKNRSPFTCMPLVRTKLTIDREPDLLDLLGDLTKGARDLFLEIKRNMDFTTYIAILPNSELSQSQQSKRSQAIQELANAGRGLARRVPQSGLTNIAGIDLRFKPATFILSPEYIYPAEKYQEEINNVWRQCHTGRTVKSSGTP